MNDHPIGPCPCGRNIASMFKDWASCTIEESAYILWLRTLDQTEQCECGRGPILAGNMTPDACSECAFELAQDETREEARLA